MKYIVNIYIYVCLFYIFRLDSSRDFAAESMGQKLYSANILAVGSSKVGEDSLSHHGDPTIGVYVIDRYTYYALEFLEKVSIKSDKTLGQFFDVCPKRLCISTVSVRKDLFSRNPDKVPLTDFFGNLPQ